jgi:hypothetical protein
MSLIQKVNVGENKYQTWKVDGAITDVDVNKPVKLSATDLLALCDDGDQIFGFIETVERHTDGGKVVCGILVAGRTYVTLSGASAVGTLVEAGANEVAGTALTGNWGVVSTHTLVAATEKQWKIISGTGLDTADVLIEKI